MGHINPRHIASTLRGPRNKESISRSVESYEREIKALKEQVAFLEAIVLKGKKDDPDPQSPGGPLS